MMRRGILAFLHERVQELRREFFMTPKRFCHRDFIS
jgi:aminoglycoside/choline kinase family phosphotransferase